MREQAQPYEQAQYQNLENRLFSQGRLGASAAYQPGGEMRSLFDSFANADLNRQLMAQQQAQQSQQAILNQIFGLTGLEQGLFNTQGMFGGLQTSAGANQASLMAQQAMAMPNLLGSLFSGAATGFMMR